MEHSNYNRFIGMMNYKRLNINETPVNTTYKLTVNASKGSNTTRALSLNGNTLNTTWKTGETVNVYNTSSVLLGTLTAQSDGSNTILSGTLTTAPSVNDVLTLKFLSDSYTSQTGTLEHIAANCDYATASVTVNAVSGNNITTTDATFANQQAIVKFTLKDKADGTSSLNATQLVVNDGGTSYTVTPASPTDVLYVAIPGISNQNVSLTATVGSDTYNFSKTGITFANSQYYIINVKMTREAKDADIGKIIATNGCIYDDVTTANSHSTAAAMIAYIGNESNCTHGLALALTNCPNTQTFHDGTFIDSNTPTLSVSGGTWRIPSLQDWNTMNSNIHTHSAILNLSDGDYWTSTSHSTSGYAYKAVISQSGTMVDTSQPDNKNTALNVRAVLAF